MQLKAVGLWRISSKLLTSLKWLNARIDTFSDGHKRPNWEKILLTCVLFARLSSSPFVLGII